MKNAIQVLVLNTGNENNSSTLRKFTKRVQESGVLKKVRTLRYKERVKSKFVTKKNTLKSLLKRAEVERLDKLGKSLEMLGRRK